MTPGPPSNARRPPTAGPHLVRMLQQTGRGKWDAVRTGLAAAQGDVLVIQDADLTAPPEDLSKFYDALASGTAEFVNGSRLIYPVEKGAMRFLNMVGNKFFSRALSYVLGQQIKDSLCGTKMLLRSDYERLAGASRRSGVRSVRRFQPALRRRPARFAHS